MRTAVAPASASHRGRSRVRIVLVAVSSVICAAVPGAAAAVPSPAGEVAAPHFHLTGGSARPHHAFFAGEPVLIRYRFTAERAVDVQIRIVKRDSGQVVRGFVARRAEPGLHRQIWAGRSRSGVEAPDGRYRVLIGRRGHNLKRAGGFAFHGHLFPVRGPHGSRGAIGEFGAPRTGGRTHEGYDVIAPCGTRLAAARGGRVLRRGFDPLLYGNYVLIGGRGERRGYFYAHLRSPARVRRGAGVRTGETVGRVGRTGNAARTPCHLHFEVRRRGSPVDPLPALRRWDAFS